MQTMPHNSLDASSLLLPKTFVKFQWWSLRTKTPSTDEVNKNPQFTINTSLYLKNNTIQYKVFRAPLYEMSKSAIKSHE